MISALKIHLSIDDAAQDDKLEAICASAIRHCEGFVNQTLIEKSVTETIPVSSNWSRLCHYPVVAIHSVMGIPADGAIFQLDSKAYAVDIDACGDGWVRVTQPGSAGRIEVSYKAGLAATWEGVPEAIQLAALRLAAHIHKQSDQHPPASVAALLRPWRRTVSA